MAERKEIIGIDHGYGYIKTAASITQSGVVHCITPPALQNNTVIYKDAYFTVGESQKLFIPDKTVDDDFYILTLAAIAKELTVRKRARKNVSVTLAAGLPIEYFAQKDAFVKYLKKEKNIHFKYGGNDYLINLDKVLVYPQGYAIVVDHLDEYEDCTVIDIGSGTIDIIPFSGRVPITSQCISLPMGVLTCIKDVQAEFRKKFFRQLPEPLIQKVMRGEKTQLNEAHLSCIQGVIRKWTERVQAALRDIGVETDFTPLAFCGGGALVMQIYGKYAEGTKFVTDIHANAKGFEKLAKACQK